MEARFPKRPCCGTILLFLLSAAVGDRSSSSAEEPLVLDVVEPAYRHCLYATETTPRIVVRERLSDGLRGKASQLRSRVVNEAGKEVWSDTATPDRPDVVRCDARNLPTGRYTVHVEAADRDGATIATARTSIRRLPPALGSEVRIDAHGNIVVNGRPTVFLGWYGTVSLEDPRPDVVALQNVQTPVVLDYPDKSPVRKAFQQHGIYSIVSLEPGRLFYTFRLWQKPASPIPTEPAKRSTVSDELRGYLTKMVELLKDEPGLLAYYLADEPEINDVRPEYLENLYQTIRELDPYHPVIVTNDTLDGIEKIGYRCCDILSPDPYSPKPDYVPSFLRQANRCLRRGQTTLLTPWHSAGDTHFTKDIGSDPPYSYRVMRGQYLSAVALGCRGFTGYTSDFFLPEPRLRYGLPHLWRTVRFLEPAMAAAAPEPLRIRGGEGLVSCVRQHAGHVYLILMNPHSHKAAVTVSHPLLRPLATLAVVAEDREVRVADGAFADELAAGDARLYTTDPAGRQLVTIAQAEGEIASQTQAARKAGNLLHASSGARARASTGTVPWFHHCFYYAINGITDDAGWHVTHAPLPQWFEVTLPREQPVGRVVVYTPNLRDYDLDFRASDGSSQTAEIRGNTATMAEHRFQPAIPALKLRIVARAIREGTGFPKAMVRELEAYADPGAGPGTEVRRRAAAATGESPPAAVGAAPGELRTLWADDFAPFRSSEKRGSPFDEAWVFHPQDFSATPRDGTVVCTSTAQAGYSAMSRILPYDPAYRFYQVRLTEIDGDGYRYFTTGFGESSGRLKCRGAVTTSKPGIYTVDTHALHEDFRSGKQKSCFVTLYVNRGVRFTFDWVRLAQQPLDGLAVTLADGTPLPEKIKAGEALRFTVLLQQPAEDAVVEVYRDSYYAPVRLNGEPYVQLLKTGPDKDGRQWSAVIKLGADTDKVPPAGYPVLFRAVLTGGPLRETFHTAFVSLE
jgi:hypothetical protein